MSAVLIQHQFLKTKTPETQHLAEKEQIVNENAQTCPCHDHALVTTKEV